MIFVAVGTQKFPMNRLLIEIDYLIENGQLEEKVFAQIGYSNYIPKHYGYGKFLSSDEFNHKIKDSDLIITHSGVATIMRSLKQKKKVIVYPRLKKFGEHVDNHQLEIAQSFMKSNLVSVCGANDDLMEVIEATKKKKFDEYISHREEAIKKIDMYVESLIHR